MLTTRSLILAATLAASSSATLAAEPPRTAHKAHDAYLTAINANDAELLMASVTDDIVLIAPNAPAMVGKETVASWVGGYFDAVETNWQKTTLEFVVAGEWAFERYLYRSIDVPHGSREAATDIGNGINIYRRDDDGVWRVARDVWATSLTSPGFGGVFLPSNCGESGPC